MGIAVVLGLMAALAYGCSDFIAGLATRRAGLLAATAGGFAAALVTTLVVIAVQRPVAPTAPVLAWGALAGLGSAVGSLFLYRGLAGGRMSVVAPLSGVVAAGLPVCVGLLRGERPGALAMVGIVVALLAIVLVSMAHGERGSSTALSLGVVDGLLAGVGFGLLYIAFDQAGTGNGVWPLVASQVVALTVVVVLGLATGGSLIAARADLLPVWAAGMLGAAATVFYLLATGHGLLSLVVVLTSLYPAVVVALAVVVLRERSTRVQVGGMVCAAIAVVLIVLG